MTEDVTDQEVIDSTNSMLRSRTRSLNAIIKAPLEILSPSPSSISIDTNHAAKSYMAARKKTLAWEDTLEKAIKSVVSITAIQTRSFDTDRPATYHATGFVVDAELGLVLSNRHVVSCGPINARGVFSDYEEVDLLPIYRDPVHDFGFFQFDVTKLKYFKTEEIALSPEKARIGAEIRVVGNDAGEKLSILQGTIARLDRPAPEYGVGTYNDFNTFYIQAASGTSGGSSGSPVVVREGCAVALNAGASQKSSQSYYLPLDRVIYALKHVRHALEQGVEVKVPRGTLQTEFSFVALDEAKRLGLSHHLEATIRTKFPTSCGVLMVRSVNPSGPAANFLENGDVLISLDGQLISNFVTLEEVLDKNVGKKLIVEILRSQKQYSFEIEVQDLHSITPSSFLEFGDGIVQDMSYMIARSYGIKVQGVLVTCNGYTLANAGVPPKSVIVSVDQKKVSNLNDFMDALKYIEDNQRVQVRFHRLGMREKERLSSFIMERRYFNVTYWQRDDNEKKWHKSLLAYVPITMSPLNENRPLVNNNTGWKVPANTPNVVKQVLKSAVVVECHVPFMIEGIGHSLFKGVGLICSVNIQNGYGLIICDRATVPTEVCRLYITFPNHLIIEGKLAYLHPTKAFAFISFSLAASGPCYSAQLIDVDPVRLIDTTNFMVYFKDDVLNFKTVKVRGVTEFEVTNTNPPRMRPIRNERLIFEEPLVDSDGGLLVSQNGFLLGLHSMGCLNNGGHHNEMISLLNLNLLFKKLQGYCQDASVKYLDAEFSGMNFTEARKLGLPVEWIQRISEFSADNKCLVVKNVFGTTPYVVVQDDSVVETSDSFLSKDKTGGSSCVLKCGDIILAANSNIVTKLHDLHMAEEFAQQGAVLEMLVWRDNQEQMLLTPLSNKEIRFKRNVPHSETIFLMGWCGITIQSAYQEVLRQTFIEGYDPETLSNLPYISSIMKGSEAECVGMGSGQYILSLGMEDEIVDDPDLKEVYDAAVIILERKARRHLPPFVKKIVGSLAAWNEYSGKQVDVCDFLRLKLMNRNGVKSVVSIRPVNDDWPTWLLVPGDQSDKIIQL